LNFAGNVLRMIHDNHAGWLETMWGRFFVDWFAISTTVAMFQTAAGSAQYAQVHVHPCMRVFTRAYEIAYMCRIQIEVNQM
jgi:hypothetical protein